MSHCYRQVSSNIKADRKNNIYYYLVTFITFGENYDGRTRPSNDRP